MKEGDMSRVVLCLLGGLDRILRLKAVAVNSDGGFEARVVVLTLLRGVVLRQAPPSPLAQLLKLRLIHLLTPSLAFPP